MPLRITSATGRACRRERWAFGIVEFDFESEERTLEDHAHLHSQASRTRARYLAENWSAFAPRVVADQLSAC